MPLQQISNTDIQTATTFAFSNTSMSGNLTFSGTGNRITGDFSNVTLVNRVTFQTSTANNNTTIQILPNGTGAGAFHRYYNSSSDPANSAFLEVGVAGGAAVSRISSDVTGTFSYFPIAFNTGGSERLRIDTNGYVLAGYASAFDLSPAGTGQYAQVSASTSSSSNWKLGSLSFSADSVANGLLFVKSRSATTGTNTVVQSGDALGNIVWRGADGTNYINGATIQAFVDGAPSTNNMPTRLGFYTNSGSTAVTERMRIDSGGKVLIGTTSAISGDARVQIIPSGDYASALIIGSNSSAANWARLDFKNTNVATSAIIYQTQAGLFSIRTDGAYPITFETNGGNERMRIDSSGNVGIGTSSPAQKLNVIGNLGVGTTGVSIGAGREVYIDCPAASTSALDFSVNGTLTGYLSSNASSTNLFTFGASPVLVFGTNNTERMRIDSGGSIGIGTSSPSSFVAGAGIAIENTNATNTGQIINFTSGGFSWFKIGRTLASSSAEIQTGQNLHLQPSSGNVGIGTTSPATKLDVNGTITATSVNSNNTFAFKNRLINGAMEIDQRNAGTALTIGTNAAGHYGPDRWAGYTGNGSLWRIQRVTTGNLDFPFAMRLQRIAGQTSADAVYCAQIVETNNTEGMAGQTVTFSFYVTAGSNYSGGSTFGFQLVSGTGTDEGMSSMNSGTWTGASYPGTTLTPTTTRTRITYTTTLGANVREIAARFYWAGSGTAGANDFVDITGCQIEIGSTATSFDYRPFGTELQLCQRYFSTSFPYGTAPAQNSGLYTWKITLITSGYGMYNQFQYPVPMRITATTITGYNGGASNNLVRNIPAAVDITNIGISPTSTLGFNMVCYGGSGDAGLPPVGWNWAASAEI